MRHKKSIVIQFVCNYSQCLIQLNYGLRVISQKNEEKRIVAGHSWVYANEVSRIENKDKNGSLATVFSHDGRFIGKGYINHASKILVRIFIRGSEDDGKQLYLNRIKAADDYRKSWAMTIVTAWCLPRRTISLRSLSTGTATCLSFSVYRLESTCAKA